MAITAERMQRLITAADAINNSLQGLDRTMAQWDIAIANGEITYEEAYRSVRPWLYRMGPKPMDLAVIEVERTHFSRERSNLYRSRERMAAQREGLPPRRAPKLPKKKPNATGYYTAPHDPTGQAIAEATRVQPQSPQYPRTAAELAAYTADANRQMEADKADMIARAEAHKPKPLPYAPPRTSQTNPYENDGMPEHGPDVTAESLLKAEADARAQANRKDKNSAPTELTTEPARVILQSSEQGAAGPSQQEPS